MKRQALVFALVICLVFGGAPTRVKAILPVPATELTQILNHVELILQYGQQVQMVRNDLQRYADMLKHGRPLSSQVFGSVTQDLQQLARVVQGGQALAYSMGNLDVQFRTTFRGYRQAFSPTGFYQNYQQWSQTSLDTTHGTLKAMGLQGSQLQNEQIVLATLHQMMQTPVGRMQAIQVGSELAEQQVEQLMKLRQLMILDLQSKQAFQAEQIQKEQADTAAQQQFFNYVPVQGDGVTFPLP
jgi:P-type conjugative transfer protein TrbJ